MLTVKYLPRDSFDKEDVIRFPWISKCGDELFFGRITLFCASFLFSNLMRMNYTNMMTVDSLCLGITCA